jgi:hypothetical protein
MAKGFIKIIICVFLGAFLLSIPIPSFAVQDAIDDDGSAGAGSGIQGYFEETQTQFGEALDLSRRTKAGSFETTVAAMGNYFTNWGSCALVNYDCGELAPTSLQGGAAGAIGGVITAMVLTPPASSVTYFADVAQNIGLVKPAYAQGLGFAGLNPVLNIWKAFRNLAYIAFILIFVLYGFMIMFRVKIDPRTVVSFQMALPKIVVALILVTFSYAIVGLMVDLSYVLIFLMLSFFETAGLIKTGGALQIQDIVFNQNIFRVLFNNFGNFAGGPAGAVGEVVSHFLGGSGLAHIAGSLVGGLAALIIAIAIVFAMFKIFFSLLSAYIGIIMSVIFAPIKLLLDVLPGQSGFAGWMIDLVANILVFPATIFMITLAAVLVGSGFAGGQNPWGVTNPGYGSSPTGGTGWVPPLLGLQGGAGVAYIPSLIALGMILMTPKVLDTIKETFKIQPSKIQIGGGLAAPFNVVLQAISQIVTLKQLTHK